MEIEMKEMGEENEMDEYDLKCAADTLLKAEEIKADPKMMAALKPYLEKKAKAIKSIADLRSARQEMNAQEEDDSE